MTIFLLQNKTGIIILWSQTVKISTCSFLNRNCYVSVSSEHNFLFLRKSIYLIC